MENLEVEKAMVAVGNALSQNAEPGTLKKRSLELARACRNSLDRSWGINAWASPDQASQ